VSWGFRGTLEEVDQLTESKVAGNLAKERNRSSRQVFLSLGSKKSFIPSPFCKRTIQAPDKASKLPSHIQNESLTWKDRVSARRELTKAEMNTSPARTRDLRRE